MPLLALGINHKTAPVEIRERLAFAPERLSLALGELHASNGVGEAAILSTCNRTELYCNLHDSAGATDDLVRWLSRFHAMPAAELKPYLYAHPDNDAVRHMLRVAAGLDSMVLGEPQILGQVKSAYQSASDAGTLGKHLERLFQHTFAVAKQVRTDTRIGESPVSVAFAAVGLAKQIFADFSAQTALLVGAGETIELVARHLKDNNIGRVIVANRTFERARELALQLDGFAIGLAEIGAHLAEADIVISSTASQQPIIIADQVSQALKKRRRRPMFMVDIAVPRDIDPQVERLDDVYLYTVDDLTGIIENNLRSRQAEAEKAEEIIDNQVSNFMGWLRAQGSAAAIQALRGQAEGLRDQLLQRGRTQLAQGKDPEAVLISLATALTNKIIHAPSAAMREAAVQGDVDKLAILRQIYGLDSPGSAQ